MRVELSSKVRPEEAGRGRAKKMSSRTPEGSAEAGERMQGCPRTPRSRGGREGREQDVSCAVPAPSALSRARALMAAGAEMRSARRASVVGATVRSDIKEGRVRERVSRKAVSRRRRAAEEKTNAIRAALDAEAPLWCAASALWATDAGLAAVDAAAPWLEMDRWAEEAGCGAVPALFELLDVRGDEGDEEEEEKDVKFSRKCSRGATKNGGRLLFSGGSGARHARRCAYALLSSRGMLKAAVVGLDADVADVDAVEEAAADAAEEDEEASAEAEAAAAAATAANAEAAAPAAEDAAAAAGEDDAGGGDEGGGEAKAMSKNWRNCLPCGARRSTMSGRGFCAVPKSL